MVNLYEMKFVSFDVKLGMKIELSAKQHKMFMICLLFDEPVKRAKI